MAKTRSRSRRRARSTKGMTRKQRSRINKAKHRAKRAKRGRRSVARKSRRTTRRSTRSRSRRRTTRKSRTSRKSRSRTKGRKRTSRARKAKGRKRSRRNPQAVAMRNLKDGGDVQLFANGLLIVTSRSGEIVFDKQYSSERAALPTFRKYKTAASYRKLGDEAAYDLIAADNPRRRRGRKGKTRRNAPIRRKDIKALKRILRDHR